MASGFLPWIYRGAELKRVLVCATGLARLTLETGFNQFFISLSLLGCWSLWVFSRRRNLCRCNQFKRLHKLFLSITLNWRWISIFILLLDLSCTNTAQSFATEVVPKMSVDKGRSMTLQLCGFMNVRHSCRSQKFWHLLQPRLETVHVVEHSFTKRGISWKGPTFLCFLT